jgi:hypothetical protein
MEQVQEVAQEVQEMEEDKVEEELVEKELEEKKEEGEGIVNRNSSQP